MGPYVVPQLAMLQVTGAPPRLASLESDQRVGVHSFAGHGITPHSEAGNSDHHLDQVVNRCHYLVVSQWQCSKHSDSSIGQYWYEYW